MNFVEHVEINGENFLYLEKPLRIVGGEVVSYGFYVFWLRKEYIFGKEGSVLNCLANQTSKK
jgi:hypothetical protein